MTGKTDKERIAELEAVLALDCENEQLAREAAAKVFGEKAHGDGYGVPTMADLMEMFCGENARLRQALTTMNKKAYLFEVKHFEEAADILRAALNTKE